MFYLTTILPNFSILWVSLQSFITPILEIILLHRIDPTNIFVNNFKVPILTFAQCIVYITVIRCRGNILYNIVQSCLNDEYVFDFVTQKFGIKHTVY